MVTVTIKQQFKELICRYCSCWQSMQVSIRPCVVALIDMDLCSNVVQMCLRRASSQEVEVSSDVEPASDEILDALNFFD